MPPLSWNRHAEPAGQTPPPQLASHGTTSGTHTQLLKITPILNGAHVLPVGQVPLQVGKPEPPLHAAAG